MIDEADTNRVAPGFFDPAAPLAELLGNLPHWRQDGVTYFLTFRQDDSVPQDLLAQWRTELSAWLAAHPEPHDEQTRRQFHALFPDRLQFWLDNGYGSCVLRLPEVKDLVDSAIRYFAGSRYVLHSHVVAANHVHALITPTGGHQLSTILHSWKSYTAHRIVKMDTAIRLLRATSPSRPTRLWQKESFDHIVRSPESFDRFTAYIAAHL